MERAVLHRVSSLLLEGVLEDVCMLTILWRTLRVLFKCQYYLSSSGVETALFCISNKLSDDVDSMAFKVISKPETGFYEINTCPLLHELHSLSLLGVALLQPFVRRDLWEISLLRPKSPRNAIQ